MPSKTWELSLYELHRSPQEAITDGTEIAVSPRSLHSELMCPICLDMLKNTMTTKECLHRSYLLLCKMLFFSEDSLKINIFSEDET